MTTPLQIHEFSDGIKPYGDYDNWESRGFAGQYMNSTLSQIPFNVKRSIDNDGFKISVQSTVAMIGRVIYGDELNSDDWSVVSIATPAKDEVRRNFPLYRYFLAEGADSLSKIVAWLDFHAKQGRMLLFNPFEIKTIGQPNISTAPIIKTRVSPETMAWLKGSSTPLIIPPEQQGNYSFPVVDSLAREKAQLTEQPPSWAYNVEALEKPERFQIILPASDRALVLIQQALASKPKEQAASTIDEKALKQAIKGLADNPSVKPEHWQTFLENISGIASSFSNSGKVDDYWHRLFDGQGASNAIKQGIYTQPMIRLLTLRAIALPETLPELLQWLQIDGATKGKAGSYAETSMEFQQQLTGFGQDPRLKESLIEGTRDLVIKVFAKIVTPENAAWLLSSRQGLWGQNQHQLRGDFRHDLEILGKQARNMRPTDSFIFDNKAWDSIWAEMQSYWRGSPRYFDAKYAPLAEFFYRLEDPQISACFYQLSCGQVPSKLFTQGFPGKRGLTSYCGLRIRQEGYNERGERFIVPVPIVAAIAIAMLVLGMGGGLLIGKVASPEVPQSSSPASASSKSSKPDEEKTNTDTKNILKGNTPASYETTIQKSIKKFADPNKTKDSLSEIVAKIKQELKSDDEVIKQTIKDTLGDPNLDFPAIDDNQRKVWVEAIYQYQNRKNISPPDGLIDKDKQTYKTLLDDVRQRTKPQFPEDGRR
jgi:hypothetical protein